VRRLAGHRCDVRLLDGGLGTQRQRRGVPVRAPLWTSAALLHPAGRALVSTVHTEYLAAGADVITANTFRCNVRALTRAGLDLPVASRLVVGAVSLARSARGASPDRRAWVAGSLAPVEDCYRPSLVPPDVELRHEHRWLAERLVAAGVDLVLVETMNTCREAVIAVEAVVAAGGRAWVSFVCRDRARLLSGEDVGAAGRAVKRAGAEVVLVNCTQPSSTWAALRRLRLAGSGPLGAYPNVEERSGIPPAAPVDRYLPTRVTPAAFASTGLRWARTFDLDVLGGCCGTTPEHIAALRSAVDIQRADAADPASGAQRASGAQPASMVRTMASGEPVSSRLLSVDSNAGQPSRTLS